DRGDAQPPAEPMAQRIDLLAHGAAVADDAPCPIEHALALRREALEARAAIDQQHPHLLLELLHACRQRRLRHSAGLGRAAEMPLPRQRQDEVELVYHVRTPVDSMG